MMSMKLFLKHIQKLIGEAVDILYYSMLAGFGFATGASLIVSAIIFVGVK